MFQSIDSSVVGMFSDVDASADDVTDSTDWPGAVVDQTAFPVGNFTMATAYDENDVADVEATTSGSVETIDADELSFYVVFYKLTVPMLFGIVALIGFVGNALVIYVVMSRVDMRRNAVNLLLLNLAVRFAAHLFRVRIFIRRLNASARAIGKY